MAIFHRLSIPALEDPETGLTVRDTIEYNLFLPGAFNPENAYGLAFSISGYGDNADSVYQKEKLCPYIADTHNLITVGVRYHNDLRCSNGNIGINIPLICQWYELNPNYFSGLNGDQIVTALHDLLISRGVYSLDVRLALQREPYHQYSSFGFLPALEHLLVLNNVLERYRIDHAKISIIGSSYGGFIASLMGKFAPNTFAMIVDNSGFSKIQNAEIFGSKTGEGSGSYPRYHDGRRYEIPFSTSTIWSLEETSEYYFSDSHRKIRSLLVEQHRLPSQTFYYCYHAENDLIAATKDKVEAYKILSKYNPCELHIVSAADIDGKIFKNLDHGMNASLRSLFDLSYSNYLAAGIQKDPVTDFELSSEHKFICSDKLYRLIFSPSGLHIQIDNAPYCL